MDRSWSNYVLASVCMCMCVCKYGEKYMKLIKMNSFSRSCASTTFKTLRTNRQVLHLSMWMHSCCVWFYSLSEYRNGESKHIRSHLIICRTQSTKFTTNDAITAKGFCLRPKKCYKFYYY